MKKIKEIVGENLAHLRKERKLTQLEIAEMFGYSDKAISKWEKGDTLPDIETLYKICNFYNVTLDYLTHEPTKENQKKYAVKRANRISIVCLLVSLVWMLATIIYVWLFLVAKPSVNHWEVFIWAVPVSCLVLFILNHLWGKRVYIFYIGTVFIWSLIVSVYLESLVWNPWPLFLLGVPAQISLLLWVGIKDSIFHHKKEDDIAVNKKQVKKINKSEPKE